jgi:hypothetical protein
MARERSARRDPRELVFALCHEVGNLLAAARLHAHLLAPEASEPQLREAARGVARAAARGGALLAQVRPLLAPDALAPQDLEPRQVLRALRAGLDAQAASRLAIDLRSAAALPRVRVAPEILQPLLLSAVFLGLEAAPQRGRVRVSAHARGSRVAFRVLTPAPPAPARGPLCGSTLAVACAELLLGACGGGALGSRENGCARLDYLVPVAAEPAAAVRRTAAAGGSRRPQTRPRAARSRKR